MTEVEKQIYQAYLESVKKSFAFKRLFNKTDVVTNPKDPLTKNRATHSLEVAQISKTIAFSLGLNSLLAEVIGLAHDLGHTPFGHLGERAIDNYFGGKFTHAKFGSFLVQNIENFNFTPEIISGIENHSSGFDDLKTLENNSEEANIVRYADKIAFIFSDYEDIFLRERLYSFSDFPELHKIISFFGKTKEARQKKVIKSFVDESLKKGKVFFGDSAESLVFSDLKKQMYQVYRQIDEKKQRIDLMELAYKVINKLMLSPYQNYIFGKILFAILTDEEAILIAENKVSISETCIERIFPLKEIKKWKDYLIFH